MLAGIQRKKEEKLKAMILALQLGFLGTQSTTLRATQSPLGTLPINLQTFADIIKKNKAEQ